MLTKDECLKALCDMCLRCDSNWCDDVCENRKILAQLINEHFDNPPLTLEELDRMQDEPIWDDWAKEWLIFGYNSDCLETLLCVDRFGNRLHLDFEENRFYRREVE